MSLKKHSLCSVLVPRLEALQERIGSKLEDSDMDGNQIASMIDGDRIVSRKPAQNVQFTSATNYCELSLETKGNLYIARFWNNGDFEYAHNCHIVPKLPVSPLARQVINAADRYRELIRCYQGTDDIQTRNEIFWSIKRELSKA